METYRSGSKWFGTADVPAVNDVSFDLALAGRPASWAKAARQVVARALLIKLMDSDGGRICSRSGRCRAF